MITENLIVHIYGNIQIGRERTSTISAAIINMRRYRNPGAEMTARCLSIFAMIALSGCATFGTQHLPKTLGEQASGYGYVPLDPLSIRDVPDQNTCLGPSAISRPLLEALPDLAIRFAVASVDADGGVNFGASKVTAQGSAYRAVLDYVNVDPVPVDFYIRKLVEYPIAPNKVARREWAPAGYPNKKGERTVGYEVKLVGAANQTAKLFAPFDRGELEKDSFSPVTIPVYVGVGLRLTADVRALKGGINLSGFGAIGVQAESNALSGTLTVQTLGVNGKAIATSLPLPNKLDQSTVEQGILAIGGTRAMLYSTGSDAADQMSATPRIVGLYSPIGTDPALINAVYSELSRQRPDWPHPCFPTTPTAPLAH